MAAPYFALASSAAELLMKSGYKTSELVFSLFCAAGIIGLVIYAIEQGAMSTGGGLACLGASVGLGLLGFGFSISRGMLKGTAGAEALHLKAAAATAPTIADERRFQVPQPPEGGYQPMPQHLARGSAPASKRMLVAGLVLGSLGLSACTPQLQAFGAAAVEQRRMVNDAQARATMAAVCDISLGASYRELNETERSYAALICGGADAMPEILPMRLEAPDPDGWVR